MSFLIPFLTLNYWILIHSIRAIARHVRSTQQNKIPYFLRIENRLIIEKVMSINVCVCSFLIFNIFDIHSIIALRCIRSILNTFDIALISCINLSQHLQHQTICIDTRLLMYTQQIRVTMGDNGCE